MKNGGACNQNFRAGSDDVRERIDVDPAVNLDNTTVIMLIYDLPCLTNLADRVRDELLAAKAWVHGHDKQHIHQTQDVADDR